MKGDAKSLSFVEDTAVAPEKLRDYIERVSRDGPRARHDGRRLRARVGRLPARAAGGQPEDRGRRSPVRGHRLGKRRSRARVRRRAVRRARRRPRAQSVHGEDVRAGALRGVPAHQAHVRSRRHLQSRQDRRRAAADVESALRPGLSHLAARRRSSTTPTTAACRAPSRCAAASACAARRSTGRCARRTWRRARRRTRRAGARTRCGWRWPASSAKPDWQTRACARCSICASSAARARPSARSAWTSRGSRASSWPTTGGGTARRSRARARTRALVGALGQPSRAGLERHRAKCAGALAERARARPRSPADAAGLDVEDVRAARFADAYSTAGATRGVSRALQRHVHELLQSRIGMAGLDVLEASASASTLAPNACCGRPLISQGLLAEAERHAAVNTDRLYPLADAGTPLVFFEPSCLSAIREDAPSLLGRRRAAPRARRRRALGALRGVRSRAECAAGRAQLSPRSRAGADRCCTAIVIRRRWARSRRRRRCSRRIPGATVVDLDAGCCGMAGSFGYMRDHFEVSRAIGERRLLPAARDARRRRRARGQRRVVPASDRGLHRRRARCIAAELLRSLMTESA